MMVQGAGFEPAKHYAQRPERCPFDHSGTPAIAGRSSMLTSIERPISFVGAGGRI